MHVTRWPSLTQSLGHGSEVEWSRLREELFATPREVDDKKKLPGFSLARFEGNRRALANVREIHAVVLDDDSGSTSLDEAADVWGDFLGLIHTTYSHAPDAPRFRIVLLVSRPMSSDEHAIVHSMLAEYAAARGEQLDPAPKDASRLWFVPAVRPGGEYRVIDLPGGPLDVDAALAARKERTAKYERAALDSAVDRIAKATNGARNETLNREAWDIARLVAAGRIDRSVAEHEMISAALRAGLSETEVRATVRSAFTAAASSPRTADAGSSGATSVSPRIEWIDTATLFEPLPEIRWLVPGIQLCAGRPHMLAGYGFSGKTLSAQSLAVCLAAGRDVWEHFGCKPATVLHLDYEQGRYATLSRYQRLAIGHGIRLDELGDRLRVAVFPSLYLNSNDAESAFSREVDGADLVITDALRGALPGEDENESRIRMFLDLQARLAEKHKVAWLNLHHAGKPSEGHSDKRTKPRGSSALFDASGCVLVADGEKNGPKLISQEKGPPEAAGGAIEDFYIVIEDVPDNGNQKGGVLVRHQSADDIKSTNDERATRRRAEQQKALVANVLRAITENPGASGRRLAQLVEGKATAIYAAIEELESDGRVVNWSTPRSPSYCIAGAMRPPMGGLKR